MAHKVSFISDIEGNWEYLVKYVELSEAITLIRVNADGSLELQLEEGWCAPRLRCAVNHHIR